MGGGQSAVIVFTDGREKSPGVYLYRDGNRVRALLEDALPTLMQGSVKYSAARFCGLCHERITGNLSLGIVPTPDEDESVLYYHGIFYVHVETWEVVHQMGSSTTVFQLDKRQVPKRYSRGQPAWNTPRL